MTTFCTSREADVGGGEVKGEVETGSVQLRWSQETEAANWKVAGRYTVKYGYATNRDGTFGGLNDFDAHMLYGKMPYKF